jgi:hypothetical protein
MGGPSRQLVRSNSNSNTPNNENEDPMENFLCSTSESVVESDVLGSQSDQKIKEEIEAYFKVIKLFYVLFYFFPTIVSTREIYRRPAYFRPDSLLV